MEYIRIGPKLEKVIIFIDHANIYFSLKERKSRIDYEKFRDILAGDSLVVATIIYMGKPRKVSKKLQRYYDYLEKIGFTIQARPVKNLPNGSFMQKGVDVLMVQNISELAEYNYFDRAIIVSGDADFIGAVKTVQELMKKIEVWSFKDSLSRNLKDEVGEKNIHYIDSILPEVLRN
jgi:uncharacterized LabA/DUF88 family protein